MRGPVRSPMIPGRSCPAVMAKSLIPAMNSHYTPLLSVKFENVASGVGTQLDQNSHRTPKTRVLAKSPLVMESW